jgi:hypothetical protein
MVVMVIVAATAAVLYVVSGRRDGSAYTPRAPGVGAAVTTADCQTPDAHSGACATKLWPDVAVQTTSGRGGVPRASVSLVPEGRAGDSRYAVTDAGGVALFADVSMGAYHVTASAAGYLPFDRRIDIGSTDVTVTVALDEARQIEVEFNDGSAEWQGATVVVRFIGAGATFDVPVTIDRGVTCAAPVDGAFRAILCSSDGWPYGWSSSQAVGPETTSIKFALTRGCRMRGAIFLSDNRPLSCDVRVGRGRAYVRTGQDGTFDAGVVPEGAHPVEIFCHSGSVKVASVVVPSGGAIWREIVLGETGGVRARIAGASRACTDVVRLGITTASGEEVARLWSDGEVEVQYLPTGAYALRGPWVSPIEFAVRARETTDLGVITLNH